MTDREKCAFLYGMIRGVALLAAIYEHRPVGRSAEDARAAADFGVDEILRVMGTPQDAEGVTGEVDAFLRAAGILKPASPERRN